MFTEGSTEEGGVVDGLTEGKSLSRMLGDPEGLGRREATLLIIVNKGEDTADRLELLLRLEEGRLMNSLSLGEEEELPDSEKVQL